MFKKILCLAVALIIIFPSSLSFAQSGAIIRFSPENSSLFSLNQYSGVTVAEGGNYVCSSKERGYVIFVPNNPLEVTRPDLTVKYKVKVEFESGILNYITTRFADATNSAVGAKSIVNSPESGKWYEGEFSLSEMSLSAGKRAFKGGDKLSQVGVDVRNDSSVSFKLIIEYLEIAVPDGEYVSETVSKGAEGEAAEDKLLARCVPADDSKYTLVQQSGNTVVEDDYYVCSSDSRGYVIFRFNDPIEFKKRNMIIRYKVKVEFESGSLSYITTRYESTTREAAGAVSIINAPKSGTWYEGELNLTKMSVSTGARPFDTGDLLRQVGVDTRNDNGTEFRLFIEYIEVVEPAVDDSVPTSGVDEINALMPKISAAKPGDTIYVEDGVYANVRFAVNANGAEGLPVTVKARNPGKAIFTGSSTMTISGQYVTVDGLYFKDGAANIVIDMTANSSYCRLTNTAIINYNDSDLSRQSKWTVLRGRYNTVDHCYFRGKTGYGNILEVLRPNSDSNDHVIEYNYFGYYAPGSVNGCETIRIGTSQESLSYANCVVRYNFFEHCDGEGESISNKSCGNVYSYNTFYDNLGALTLRHGDDCTVNGNIFLGGSSTNRVTGVRVIGKDQKVYDNYFYNMGDKTSAASIESGTTDFLVHEYEPVTGLEFRNNTFIDNNVSIRLGSGYNKDNRQRAVVPEGKVYDNLIYSSKSGDFTLFTDEASQKLVLSNNIAYGKPLGYTNSGVIEKDPGLVLDPTGFWVSANSNIGMNPQEANKAPKHPTELTPDWITKMYESGELTFDTGVENPFWPSVENVDDGKIKVTISGEKLVSDVDPLEISGRVLVPMRAIFEALGADVQWDDETKTATASLGNGEVKITENATTAYVNKGEVTLDVPASIVNGRFIVPVRFISESFGANVVWRELLKTVVITPPKDASEMFVIGGQGGGIAVIEAQQSGDDGSNSIDRSVDGNNDTRWAVAGTAEAPAWGIFDFGETKVLDEMHVMYSGGNTRVYSFSVEVSTDGVNYKTILDNQKTSGQTLDFEKFSLGGAEARYVKYVGYGNNTNDWNNIFEFVFTEKK